MLKRRWKISNSIWAKPRAGQLYRPPLFRAEPTGKTLAFPQRQLSWTGGGGIIDRQEKGGPHPLCLVNERENQREESGGEGKRRMRRPTKGGEK